MKNMKELLMAVNAVSMADGGGHGSSGGQSIDVDYGKIDTILIGISKNIKNISDALSEKINVTSYSGSAQGEVESAVDSIRTYLATMEKPLSEMQAKVDEIRNTYKKSESDIKSALAGIKGDVSNG